jgi:cell division transport system permease protein
MAIKVDYVVRETAANLTRNITLTLASVLTVVVSLTLFGSAFMLNQGVNNANDRFKGGIEFIVYLQPDASQEVIDSVGKSLRDNPDVERADFVNKDETLVEFRRLFKDSRQLLESITADILPPSFRVAPKTQDPEVVQALGDVYRQKAGVYDVIFAFEVVKRIQETFNKIGVRFLVASGLLLLAALMLILNTIRVAMFARRREIEVMKLVGATNWFIRVPFIVEGIIQTLIGAGVAVLAMTFVIRPFIDELSQDKVLPIFQGFVVTDANLVFTNLLVVGVAVLIGAVGSAVAVSRFLDV